MDFYRKISKFMPASFDKIVRLENIEGPETKSFKFFKKKVFNRVYLFDRINNKNVFTFRKILFKKIFITSNFLMNILREKTSINTANGKLILRTFQKVQNVDSINFSQILNLWEWSFKIFIMKTTKLGQTLINT